MSTIASAIESAGFGAFARMLRASRFADLLESGGPYTIFAPTDAAFAKFPKGAFRTLMEADEVLLHSVASYHFAAGKVMSARFSGKRIRAVTYGGQSLIIDGRNGLRVNMTAMVAPDLYNGACVVHGIDGVLWPRQPEVVAR
ncbi:MAG: fasciclin domain-containing protein [Caulobacterales bacterium]